MTTRWRWDWLPGFGSGGEDFACVPSASGHILSGKVAGTLDDAAIDGVYTVEADAAWLTRRVTVKLARPGRTLELRSNGAGRWSDGDGVWIPALDGCLDVDLSLTPSTNTLPIRRLGLEVGEAMEIAVAYVEAPELKLRPRRQIYTRLGDRLWRFHAPDIDFTADIAVDADGFVIEYPGLCRRAA